MTNLYYDNPLHVLAAVQHGAKLSKRCNALDLPDAMHIQQDYTILQDSIELKLTTRCDTRFYIAEESLHIFEPKEGDLCEIQYIVSGEVTATFFNIWREEVPEYWHCKRIMKRDGKSFETPLRENAK